MSLDDDTDRQHLIKLRINMSIVLKKLEKIEDIIPLVRDNSWWINKIKIGFVTLSVGGVALGLIKLATN